MGKRRAKLGRRFSPPFVRLDQPVHRSAAFRALSTNARALILEVISLHNGLNNGELFLSVRDAAKAIGLADVGAAGRALKELVQHGFLAVTNPGHFAIKVRHATQYRLTFEACGDRPPTNEWRNWRPEPGTPAWTRLSRLRGTNLRCGKEALAVLESCTEGARKTTNGGSSVTETNTGAVQNQHVADSPSAEETGTQVVCHGEQPTRASPAACAKVRGRARQWLSLTSGGQRKLAHAAGLTEPKLSRFLSDRDGRRTVTVQQLTRLNAVLADMP